MWSVVSGFLFLLQTLWSYLSTNKACACAIFFTVQPSIGTGDSDGHGRLCCSFHGSLWFLMEAWVIWAVGLVAQQQHFISLSMWTRTFGKPLAAWALFAACPHDQCRTSGSGPWIFSMLCDQYLVGFHQLHLILTCDSGAGNWPLSLGSWASPEVWGKSQYPAEFGSYLASNIKEEADLHFLSSTRKPDLI